MDQKRDIEDASDEQGDKRARADKHGEQRRDFETSRNDGVALEVLLDIPPRPSISLLGQIDGIERERVDGLTRCVSKEKTLPDLEGEEDEEGKVV